MRTTLTLDDDVAAAVARQVRRSGRPLKQVVNDLIRHGLAAGARPAPRRFRVKPFHAKLAPGLDLDNIGALIEQVEGPAHR